MRKDERRPQLGLGRRLWAFRAVLMGSFRNVVSGEASGEHIARPHCRGTRLTAARPRVFVVGVRVSGTLPQRGSLCSPNRVFP